MNTRDFLQLSKRNIFHSFIQSNDKSDPKYIPNYAPTVIVEFNDLKLLIKDFNTKKILLELNYDQIKVINIFICSRLMAVRFAPTKMYDIEYSIELKNYIFHFECKNASIWRDVSKILDANNVKLNDPLEIIENIKSFSNDGEFYNFCQKNITVWKNKYKILDPKIGDLI